MKLKVNKVSTLGFIQKAITDKRVVGFGAGSVLAVANSTKYTDNVFLNTASGVAGGISGIAAYSKLTIPQFGALVKTLIFSTIISKNLDVDIVDNAIKAVNVKNWKILAAGGTLLGGSLVALKNALKKEPLKNALLELATSEKDSFTSKVKRASDARENPLNFMYLTVALGTGFFVADGVENIADPNHINTIKDYCKVAVSITVAGNLWGAFKKPEEQKIKSSTVENLNSEEFLDASNKNLNNIKNKFNKYIQSIKEVPSRAAMDGANVSSALLGVEYVETISAFLVNISMRNLKSEDFGRERKNER